MSNATSPNSSAFFPEETKRRCFICEPKKRPGKPWTSRKILSVSALQAGRVSDFPAAPPAFIACLNMRERVVFVLLSCLVIPAQTRVLLEQGLRTACLTVPWHCLSCQTTRGSKHTASWGELAERLLCINMQAAAQIAAVDANESWSSYSEWSTLGLFPPWCQEQTARLHRY